MVAIVVGVIDRRIGRITRVVISAGAPSD